MWHHSIRLPSRTHHQSLATVQARCFSGPPRSSSARSYTQAMPATTTTTRRALGPMPRLPVPPLAQSVNLYLRSIIPLLLQSADHAGDPDQFELQYRRRHQWAAELIAEHGLGRRLQERLIDVDRASPHNWLDDNYWIKAAYHANRTPLPINSNWWILLHPDPDIPARVLQSIPEQGRFTDWQLRRAALLVNRFMIFKHKFDRQEIIPDSSRAARWQRHWLDSLYGVTRIPQKPADRLNIASPSARHIVVLARDHIYTLDVLDANLCPYPSNRIESGLWSIINHVTLQPPAPSIGSLTGLDRGSWSDTREDLLRLSGSTNRASLTMIEDALFALCLDDSTRPGDTKGHIRVASTNSNGSNRWFDKSFSLIVENNSRASVLGEHSPCDALVPAIVTDFVMAEGVGAGLCDPKVKRASVGADDWRKLDWVTDDRIHRAINQAQQSTEAISSDSDAEVIHFLDYGVNHIKESARLSPDAFIQMAIQLAWYRQTGTVVPTYETGLTRLFKHGRTDTIRTLSKESYEWVKAMGNATSDPIVVHGLLNKAIMAHNHFTKEAGLGRAFDRHFLGLRLQHRPEEDGPLPELFTDSVFAQSAGWELSTSGLSAGDRFLGTGFGCYENKGYGINYLASGKMIKFGIESKFSDPRTSTKEFAGLITEAMRDMRRLCELVQNTTPEGLQAKL